MEQEISFLSLAIGIAVAGYFIGNGLRNFKNPVPKEIDQAFNDDLSDVYGPLLSESDVHHYLGISKKDVHDLLHKYPDIPHIELNGNVYYPKKSLRQWVESFQQTKSK